MACLAVHSQSATAFFELVLPDLTKTIGSGNVVADIPADRLSRLSIQLLGSADKNLGYGDVNVRINGKGVGNIFNSGANDRGKFFTMDPSTIANRRDAIFDPGENTIEVYGADRRGRSYYQNWILRSANENANRYFTYVSELSPTNETGLPPDLNIDEPVRPITFSGTSIRSIAVRVKGNAGAASGIATLTIDGNPVRNPGPGVSFSFDQTVNVAQGTNALVVQAIDRKRNRRSITIPVLHPPSGPQRLRMSGEKFALLVGISRFGSFPDALPPITAAAADARLLAAGLKQRGFRDQDIRLLTDDQATLEQIRNALGDFTARAKPEDLLIVFISTHGLHDPSAPQRLYVAAADTQRKALRDTAIEVSELQTLLNRALRCRHTLLFFDAEHPLGNDWNFPGKTVVHAHLLNLFDGSSAPSVLVSSSAGQDSQDKADGGASRGVFAGALSEAMSGAADVNNDGVLTPRELCAYVSETVRQATGAQQAPEYRFSESEADTPVLSLRH